MPDPRRVAAHDTIAGSCHGNRNGPVKIKTLECFLADRRRGIHTNAVERAIRPQTITIECALRWGPIQGRQTVLCRRKPLAYLLTELGQAS